MVLLKEVDLVVVLYIYLLFRRLITLGSNKYELTPDIHNHNFRSFIFFPKITKFAVLKFALLLWGATVFWFSKLLKILHRPLALSGYFASHNHTVPPSA
jgi:hypothetical protein